MVPLSLGHFLGSSPWYLRLALRAKLPMLVMGLWQHQIPVRENNNRSVGYNPSTRATSGVVRSSPALNHDRPARG